MATRDKIKVLIAKTGIDAHDTGARTVAWMLREAGFEVIYLGCYNPVDAIVQAAIQEDVDVIGLSFHEASYMRYTADLMKTLRKKESKAMVVVGGVIKERDIPKLKELGVAAVFLPGAKGADIAKTIRECVAVT